MICKSDEDTRHPVVQASRKEPSTHSSPTAIPVDSTERDRLNNLENVYREMKGELNVLRHLSASHGQLAQPQQAQQAQQNQLNSPQTPTQATHSTQVTPNKATQQQQNSTVTPNSHSSYRNPNSERNSSEQSNRYPGRKHSPPKVRKTVLLSDDISVGNSKSHLS